MIKDKTIIRDWIEILLVSLIIVFFIKRFFFTTYYVPSASMEDYINIGDKIIVNRLSSNFEKGDILAFFNPVNTKLRMIKRVVGLPGDKLELKEGTLYINGIEDIRYQGIKFLMIHQETLEYLNELEVPEKSYYLLGDNIGNSRDSRYWGFVPDKNIIGKSFCIYWPLDHFKVVK